MLRCTVCFISVSGKILDVNLNLAPNIQSLSLKQINAVPTENEASWPWLLRLLSSIRNPNRIVLIQLEVKICKEVNMCCWGDVDSILAGPDFQYLRKIDINLWPAGIPRLDWEEALADVVRGLPLLGARGVLVEVHL
jgi:hypothetical protein